MKARSLTCSALLVLASGGCGGSGSHSPTGVAAAVPSQLSMSITVQTTTGDGLRSPVSISARFSDTSDDRGIVESVSFSVVSSAGAVLVHSTSGAIVIPSQGFGEIRQELSWLSEEVGAGG